MQYTEIKNRISYWRQHPNLSRSDISHFYMFTFVRYSKNFFKNYKQRILTEVMENLTEFNRILKKNFI